MNRVLSFVLLITLLGCGREPAPVIPAQTSSGEAADPAFVGKVWISTTPGAPLGAMRIFLPNRTLVMGSCAETYRLVEWGIAGDHVRWADGAIPIEEAVEMPRPNQLILKIAGRDESYLEAGVPYRCPEA